MKPKKKNIKRHFSEKKKIRNVKKKKFQKIKWENNDD
jgi:hypothetical protein